MSQQVKTRSHDNKQTEFDENQKKSRNKNKNILSSQSKEKKQLKRLKSKKKHKIKNKKYCSDDEEEVKQQSQIKKSEKRLKEKMKKHKLKKKKKKQSSEQIKQQQPKLDDSSQDQRKNHQKLKRHNNKQKHRKKKCSRSQTSDEDKIQAIDVQQIKFEEDNLLRISSSPVKKQLISFEDSERIIHLFSLDAGDYKGLREQLPHVGQKNIRNHLKAVFEHCLDQITQRVKSTGRKIKQWQPQEKRQIIRQLHRIRSSNRLLSQTNVELRQVFHKIMKTYNHRQVIMTEKQINFLYKRIESFVRGFNQPNSFRKNSYVPPDQQDQTRKPLIEGGYIMEQKVKRQQKKNIDKMKTKIFRIDPEKLVFQWTEIQERQICILYLQNKNHEFMIENLRTKFGQNDKWGDFEILGKKIDHIIKLGLNRLQQLTMKPYHRIQKMIEDERKAKMKAQLQKRLKEQKILRQGPSTIEDFKEVIYYNSDVKQVKEGRLIKNPSLLLRQVFAHPGQSFRVSRALVQLLIQRYPEEQQVQNILTIIKDFTEWAAKEQAMSGVLIVKNRPVLDQGIKPKKMKGDLDSQISQDSLKQRQEEAEIAEGLSLIQDEDIEKLIKKQAEDNEKKSNFSFQNGKNPQKLYEYQEIHSNASKSTKKAKNQQISMKEQSVTSNQGVIQVYESEQSQYEGFISNETAKITKK